MKLPSAAKRKWNYTALSFLLPFVGMLLVMLFSQYHPFGKYSMLYSDSYHQYYPFFVDFRRALRSGDSLLYNWSIGMGIDYLGLVSYYLASPLNLLSVLVPEKLLLDYFSLLIPIKLGLAGLFYGIFLKSIFEKNDFSVSVFASFYALCAWALGYQWNIMWLDTFALLPLVILGTVSLIRDRKFVLYTVTLFLAVFSNYYIGLFVCYFVALVFFCYEICRFRGWKAFYCDLGRIALYSALAIGMTLILTLPTLAALRTTQSSVNKFPTTFSLNITSEKTILGLLGAMRSVAGNMGGGLEPTFKEGLPNIYCGIGTIVLAFLYLLADDIRLRDKLCALFLLLFFNVSFIIRQLDYIWHGFHFTNMIPYRFSFLYSFVLLYMAYGAWIRRGRFDFLQIASAGFLTAAILCCSDSVLSTISFDLFDFSVELPLYLLYNSVFLVLYAAVLLYGRIRSKPADESEAAQTAVRRKNRLRRKHSRAYFLSVVVVEMLAAVITFGAYFRGTSVANYPKGTEEAASMIRYMHERESRSLFYRAETTHSQTLNDGALNGYRGISAFTSSANVHVTEFLKALGYGAKNTYNRYCFEESSPVANLFLDLKYMIERDGNDRASSVFEEIHHFGKVHLLKNSAYLPLGFLAEPELAEVDFSEDNGEFKFQNRLFAAAAGVPGEVWHRVKGEYLELLEDNMTVTENNQSGYCSYSDCRANAELVYSYTADRAGFACIHLNLPKRNDFYVSVNGNQLYRETISLPQMLAVQDLEVGDVVEIRVLCGEGESGTMSVAMAILDDTCFREGYEHLAQSQLKLTSFQNTCVEGTIDCVRDGLLYTSIPQNGNWHAIVDGQEAEILLTGDCMISLLLTEGTHTVSFEYRNAAYSLGWKLSAACCAVFLLLVQMQYHPDWKHLLPILRQGKFER